MHETVVRCIQKIKVYDIDKIKFNSKKQSSLNRLQPNSVVWVIYGDQTEGEYLRIYRSHQGKKNNARIEYESETWFTQYKPHCQISHILIIKSIWNLKFNFRSMYINNQIKSSRSILFKTLHHIDITRGKLKLNF